jgi:ABC-type polar amino acid transport system ATPase subunit
MNDMTAGSMAPLLEISGLSKFYSDIPVLDRVDLAVHASEIVMIIGPSGAGKSTMLRCINRIEQPSEGEIIVAGTRMTAELRDGRKRPEKSTELAAKRRKIGMVFQRFNLFAHLSALDNVAVGPHRVLGIKLGEARERAALLLERVQLAGHAHKKPAQLSGGQQQRVAIARALAMRPVLMLFDEPTSALDPELVGEVLAVIRELAADGMTMLVVTHEMQFAREIGTRIVFMDGGRIVETAPPASFFQNPVHDRSREFLRRVTERGA